jgi:anti-sigma-K factor RskA
MDKILRFKLNNEDVELITNYLDGTLEEDKREIVESKLIHDDEFRKLFMEAYEFLETLKYLERTKKI